MRTSLSNLIFVLGIALLIPRSLAMAEEPVRVMTWNLEWFYDDDPGDNHSELAKEQSAPSRDDWDWKRDGVAQAIAKIDPTIAAFQEVENRRVMWYLSRALDRDHNQKFEQLAIESRDFFTEQDVGFLVRKPAEVTQQTVFNLPDAENKNKRFYDVTKHLMGVFEIRSDDGAEELFVINLHLRSGADAEELRNRQSRLVHRWIADLIADGKNVIVLGDFNTEMRDDAMPPEGEVSILAGRHTDSATDDLVDLLVKLPRNERQTHLLRDRQFDRILCSRALIEDAPDRNDLVFDSIEVRRDLAIRGPQDTPEGHWDDYWAVDGSLRDLSDHYPVVATFIWK